jgi:hypothetical protein
MRRALSVLVLLLTATAARGATSYFLDRAGLLWNASAEHTGLVLTAQSNGQEVVHGVVPFALGLAGTSDTQIQVVADDLTGKVAVVWQRNWTATSSEIMVAVWNNGNWERVTSLTADMTTNPRNPAIAVTETADTETDPNDSTKTVTYQDSYLNVVWWEGVGSPHASVALLRLTADAGDESALTTANLDDVVGSVAINCPALPADLIEHPLFASQGSHDSALVFFGSEKQCMFSLLQVGFQWESEPTTANGTITVTAQQRRSRPVFGVRGEFGNPIGISMEGARVLVGTSLRPVTYRVDNNTIQYIVATATGWSPMRTVSVAPGLTMYQAIPLVENLAR